MKSGDRKEEKIMGIMSRMRANMRTIVNVTERSAAGDIRGRRIVNIDTERKTVTLDNSVVLELEDAADCCAWYEVNIAPSMDFNDNIITGVTCTEFDANDAGRRPGHYALNVLSHDMRIFDVTVDGDPTSGYYCQSFTLNVKEPTARDV